MVCYVDAPYDPLASLMAPPSRSYATTYPQTTDNSGGGGGDPLAALMAPPPMRNSYTAPFGASTSGGIGSGPPMMPKPQFWTPPPVSSSSNSNTASLNETTTSNT